MTTHHDEQQDAPRDDLNEVEGHYIKVGHAPAETADAEAHGFRYGGAPAETADAEAHSFRYGGAPAEATDVEAHLALPDTPNEAPAAQGDDEDVEGHAYRGG